MYEIIELLYEANQSGVWIWLDGDKLKCKFIEGIDSSYIIEKIKENKTAIIKVLKKNKVFDKNFVPTKIYHNDVTDQAVLSFAQERIWFIELYEQGTNAYHIPSIYEIDLQINIQGIKYALTKIVSRHEVLRSTIEQGENQDYGIQKVHNKPLVIEEISLNCKEDYKSLINDDIDRPFCLSKEYPIRVKLYSIQSDTDTQLPDKTLLLINIHHIASDGWSVNIFKSELFAYYKAYINNDTDFCLPALEIQYKDYAVWQKHYLKGELLQKQVNYWKEKLSGYQTLELPTNFARPAKVDFRGAQQSFVINKEVSDKLRALAKQHDATLQSVMLSSVAILLSKYTGQDDIVTGSPIANRQSLQTEDLIGFFVNTMVNRTLLCKSQSFKDLIQQVHQNQIEMQLHQDIPFEKIIVELGVVRDASRHPIFQVMFVVNTFDINSDSVDSDSVDSDSVDSDSVDSDDIYFRTFQSVIVNEPEKVDLSITIEDDGKNELIGEVSYATSLFEKNFIAKLIECYEYLLIQLTEAPKRFYSQISLLTKEEYEKIVYQWNANEKEFPIEKTICQLFQEQAEKNPDNVALVYEDQRLTYRELNEKSNQLARHIREQYKQRTSKDLCAGTLIALYLDRNIDMITGILAVLKAGGAYVPIDINYPQERIDYILEDTRAELVLSHKFLNENSLERLPQNKMLYIDLTEELYSTEDRSNLSPHSKSEDLVYVIYTSGTTGKPKGVELTHASLINLVFAQKKYSEIDSESKMLQYASLVFDASAWEIFSALSFGAGLFIVSTSIRQDAVMLSSYLEQNKITIANIPPVLLSSMPFKELSDLRTLIVAGESCSEELMLQWSNARKLINAYGPTESTVCATMHIYQAGDSNVNIGKPLDNISVYVLDNNKNPVPVGVNGELYIGGASLARGYLNRPDLTLECFITNPFATEFDKTKGYTRLYKTGDLVRWLPDGNLEFIGRCDGQVKIRGYRIELGEIEHALMQIDGIKQCGIVTREKKTDANSNKYIVAYYVADAGNTTLSQISLAESLSQVLPEYMIPATFIAMEKIPLTVNGKFDKMALPDPDINFISVEYVAPSNEMEITLCKIWQEVLGLEKVGIMDNFFRIGGDSILSIQVSNRIRQSGFNCQVKDIFEYKTISMLAEHLMNSKYSNTIKSEQGVLTGELELLPIQQWFFKYVDSGDFVFHNHWNQNFLIKVPELSIEKLQSVIQKLVSYHDVLRIKYVKEQQQITSEEDNCDVIQWKQIYQSDIDIPALKTMDVSRYSENEIQEILTQWQSNFNIEHGPMFQVGYLYGYEDGSARIFFALHHTIVDAVCHHILADDIKTLYEEKLLPNKGSSYRQWVESVMDYPSQHSTESAYWENVLDGIPKCQASIDDSIPGVAMLELDETLTGSLLHNASKAYNTEINDLLLTALVYTLKDFNHNNVQGITLEGHGREDTIDPSIDTSHTVGWFTTLFPVRLELQDTIEESIKCINDSMRNIPNKGIGFGAFATRKDVKYSYDDLCKISFNYLGQSETQQLEEMWKIVEEESGRENGANRFYMIISMNGIVNRGKFSLGIETQLGQDVAKQLRDSYEIHLTKIIVHCIEKIEKDKSVILQAV